MSVKLAGPAARACHGCNSQGDVENIRFEPNPSNVVITIALCLSCREELWLLLVPRKARSR